MIKDYVYTSPWVLEPIQTGIRLGREVGFAKALVVVLRVRGISTTEQTLKRILAERDIERIELWLERAVTANSVDDVFGEPNRTVIHGASF